MDILNWIYLVKSKFIKTTIQDKAKDLVILGNNVSFDKRGDKYQSYGMTVTDFANQLPVVSGGGGFNALIPLGSGNIYSNIPTDASSNNINISADTIVLSPFIPAQSFTTSNLSIQVVVLGAGVSTRILLYSHSSANGLPDTKLYESANLDCSTTGIKTATTSQTFTAGTTYWLGYYANGSTPSVSGTVTAALLQIGMTSAFNQYTIISSSTTFGSAPSTWVVAGTNRLAAAAIRIGLTSA